MNFGDLSPAKMESQWTTQLDSSSLFKYGIE